LFIMYSVWNVKGSKLEQFHKNSQEFDNVLIPKLLII